MNTLWTASDAAAATRGQVRGDWTVNGISIDSRTTMRGDLFVALKDQRDGHDFVAAALAAGASAALVDHVPVGLAPDAPLLVVPNVLKALEDLARAARARMNGVVIAVTGSAGKTTTKEMLRMALGRQGKTHAAERSFNNHWGVPLTLARMPADTEFAVIEIGMSNPGEIAPLSKLARPHVAMITTIAPAHLAAFDDLAGIAHEKAAIFEGLEPEGVQIVCANLEQTALDVLHQTSTGAERRIWFGSKADNPWHITDVSLTTDRSIVQAMTPEGPLIFKLAAPGKHFALNALGALAAVTAAGADAIVAAHDLAGWRPVQGRGTRETIALDLVHDDETLDLYDDAFNANPASMAAALGVLANHARGKGNVRPRRVAILGDMLELGADEADLHRAIAGLKALRKIDLVHTVGPRMRHLHDTLKPKRRGQHFDTAQQAAARAHRLVRAHDAVLVKGSKGSQVSLVVDAIRKLGHPKPTKARGT